LSLPMGFPGLKALRQGIARKVIGMLLIFGMGPMVLLTAIFLCVYLDSQTRGIFDLQNEICNRVVMNITGYLEKTASQIQLLAIAMGTGVENRARFVYLADTLLNRFPECDGFTLTDAVGNEIHKAFRHYTFREFEYVNIAHLPSFQMALKGRIHIGAVEVSQFSRFPIVRISAPIRDVRENLTGVLVAWVNISRMWGFIARDHIGKDRYAYVVDDRGLLIAFEEISSVLEKRDLSTIRAVGGILNKKAGADLYQGLSGKMVIGAFAPIPPTDWGVVVEEPVVDAYRSVYPLFLFFVGVFLITIFLAAILGFRFSYSGIVAPLKALEQEAEAIAGGDFRRKIAMTSSDELAQLAASFNRMAENLEKTTVSRDLLVKEMAERERVEAEKERAETRLRQSQKLEAIGTLAGGVAHDFNNILSIILGNTELAIDALPDVSPARECMEEVRIASLRARDVVKQLLSFSRRVEERRQPLNILPIIGEALRLVQASTPPSIDIITDLPESCLGILADPNQIHQVIVHLCANAVDAMRDAGGTLTVAVRDLNADAPELSDTPDLAPGKYLMITVCDTGTGILPAHAHRIFDPYFSTKDVGKGAGMGLSVVYGIVKGHRGAIHVESEVGIGTVCEILIPAMAETEVADVEMPGYGAMPSAPA